MFEASRDYMLHCIKKQNKKAKTAARMTKQANKNGCEMA